MEALLSSIAEQVMQQGLSMSLFAVAVIYFHRRQNKLESKLNDAQVEMVKYLKEDREKLIILMEDNREVMAQTNTALQRIEMRLTT